MSRKSTKEPLKPFYNEEFKYEIGIDEVGRGPMFGRVYTAAVILPKSDVFDHYYSSIYYVIWKGGVNRKP